MGSAVSTPLPATSGVPQGSIIGPLLFIIYMNSISVVPLSPTSDLTLYADDMSLSKTVTNLCDLKDTQNDVNSLKLWADTNHLTFNVRKTKFMLLSRKCHSALPTNFNITLGDFSIERVHQFKYLGVTISANLSWDIHINEIFGRTRRQVGLLFRRFYRHTTPAVMLKLYKAIIRPHLEYCPFVWDPPTFALRKQVESVQKFAQITHRRAAIKKEVTPKRPHHLRYVTRITCAKGVK